jgi:hypothetical protein
MSVERSKAGSGAAVRPVRRSATSWESPGTVLANPRTSRAEVTSHAADNERRGRVGRVAFKHLTWQPLSSRSITRFRAAWVTQAAVGCAVTPRIRIRRAACSMTARTDRRAPAKVVVWKKSAMIAWAWERRNAAHVLLVRWGAGSTSAWWRISQTVDAATFTPRDEQFAVDSAISPGGVLSGQAQDQPADRPDGSWPPDPVGPGTSGVPPADQVPVPAQHSLGADQQLQVVQYATR